MMLKGASGANSTSCGRVPGGASHASKARPAQPRRARCAAVRRLDGAERRRAALVSAKSSAPGVAQHRREARRRRRRRERRDDDAGAQRAEEDGRIAHRARRADRDRLARPHAVALQRGGDAVHQGVERAVVERASASTSASVAGRRARARAPARRGFGRAGRRRAPSVFDGKGMLRAPRSAVEILRDQSRPEPGVRTIRSISRSSVARDRRSGRCARPRTG